jgi:hypothetical protein
MVADVPWNSETLFKIIPYHLWTAKLPCGWVGGCVVGKAGGWVGVEWGGGWGMGACVRGDVCARELRTGTRDYQYLAHFESSSDDFERLFAQSLLVELRSCLGLLFNLGFTY